MSRKRASVHHSVLNAGLKVFIDAKLKDMELSGFYSAAHAETTGQEEAVDLGALDSSKPRWNPYQFDRAPALIAVPALILLIVVLHLFRRRRRQPLNPSRAEEFFND